MKIPRVIPLTAGLATALALLTVPGHVRANDWTGTIGDWSDPANWNGGVPDSTSAWAIGNVNNGGTAIVSTVVPPVSEAWAGNGGGAGHIIVTNGGTLTVNNWLVMARMYESASSTPFSTVTIHDGILNKTGDGFIVGDNYQGLSGDGQLIVAGNGQVNVTGGWWGIGNGANSRGTAIFQDNAVVNAAGQDFNVGDYGTGSGMAFVKDNARLTLSRFWIGKGDSVAGALYQSGGAIIGTSANANEWTLGGQDAAHLGAAGLLHMTAGAFTNVSNFQIGRNGNGLIYQSGGIISVSGWTALGRFTTGRGAAWLTGGSFFHTGTGSQFIIGEDGRGELTLAGSALMGCNLTLRMANVPTGQGYLNLNGGTLRVPRIEKTSPAGIAHLSLNGGVIEASANDALFLQGLDSAYIYGGGAIFNTAGYDITVAQTFSAPSGQGVASVPVTDGGAGYVAPPIVEISGDGTGATAVAEIDPVLGKVTNIVVTSAGHDYTYAAAILHSGGSTLVTPATAGTPVLGAVTSGGLVKNGQGTLTLAGANSYTGATVVNAGGLVLNTAASLTSSTVTVADGAQFGAQVHQVGGQTMVGALTLGTTAGTELLVDFGDYGNPFAAPLFVTGPLTVNGTVTVNIAAGVPAVGTVPLVLYGTRSGSGTFVLGSLPVGVQATIVNNTAANSIDLVISSVAKPRWDGVTSGAWDIATTQNWIEQSTLQPVTYQDGLEVLFDDNALGTTTVDLTTAVSPAKTVVNATNLAYTFTGAGKISGTGSLVKRGPNTLTIQTLNDYTGPTRIEGGTVVVTNLANGGQPSPIGQSSSAAANLVLAGGVLSYAGPATTTDRAYRSEAGGSGLDLQSDVTFASKVEASTTGAFVKSGPGTVTYAATGTNVLSGNAIYRTLAGKLVLDGTAGAQVNQAGEMWIGAAQDAPSELVLNNTTLNVGSWLAVGRGNGSVNNHTTMTVNDSKVRTGNFSMGYWNNNADNLARQTLSLNGSSTFTNMGDVNLGEGSGSTTTVLLNGTSKFFSDSRVHVGWPANGTGVVTLAESSAMYVDAWMSVANEGGDGTLNMKDNSTLWVLWDLNITDVNTGQGVWNIQDNAVASANNFFIGKGVGSSAVVNQTGGSVIGLSTGNEYHVGFHGLGTWNLSAGTIAAPNHWFVIGRYTDGPGELNVTGGSITHGGGNTGRLVRVGEEGMGTLNLSGTGSFVSLANEVTIGWLGTGNGTVNLNGGTFEARRIIGGAGSSVFNFNGGVLKAAPNANANFMTALTSGAYVQGGGAIIDTAGNNIAINQDLMAGNGTGGLTKRGAGNLGLNGNNSYVGATTIEAGGFGGNGTFTGPVVVQADGGFSPGLSVGAMTINNTLSLAGLTIMEIDKANGTNDQVLGVTTLTYGGTLVITNIAGTLAKDDTFKLFTAGTYTGTFANIVSGNSGVVWDTSRLGVDGTVKVVSAVSDEPIEIETSVTDDELTVSWPTTHVGWVLQSQTNSLSVGLSNNWVTIPGSSTTNKVIIPIVPENGSVFLRLTLP